MPEVVHVPGNGLVPHFRIHMLTAESVQPPKADSDKRSQREGNGGEEKVRQSLQTLLERPWAEVCQQLYGKECQLDPFIDVGEEFKPPSIFWNFGLWIKDVKVGINQVETVLDEEAVENHHCQVPGDGEPGEVG